MEEEIYNLNGDFYYRVHKIHRSSPLDNVDESCLSLFGYSHYYQLQEHSSKHVLMI